MKKTIIFIHGMFLNAKSWDQWKAFFETKGYNCIAEPWPLHEGDPADLRAHVPPGLGELPLQTVVDRMTDVAGRYDKPIIIGHSLGGLIVQLLVNKGLAGMGVAISSVAPNAMLSFDWNFFRNSMSIMNPFKGDHVFEMTDEGFHQNFGNAMTREASDAAWAQYAMHESRNVLRDALGEAGQVDTDLPHVPLLFIGAEKDHIIPPQLNEKNVKAYTDETSVTDFKEFPGRGHYICGQPGWEEVAGYVYEWIQKQGGLAD